MQLDPYVIQVQSQLTAAAAIGGDTARATADALTVAAEPAVRLAVLGAVSAAADEITAALLDSPSSPIVSVRIDGGDLRVEVRHSEPSDPVGEVAADSPDDAEYSARISLRLPEALKSQIETTARSKGVSVNTWIVRAASYALSGSGRRGRRAFTGDDGAARHITGWING